MWEFCSFVLSLNFMSLTLYFLCFLDQTTCVPTYVYDISFSKLLFFELIDKLFNLKLGFVR